MKSKIEEILYKHSERVGLYEGDIITCVDENEFDDIAEEVVKLFTIPVVTSSAWEQKLVGKNIHSVFTWCKDCHNEGINIPFNDECGNCGNKNTVRYYDKETIDLLF